MNKLLILSGLIVTMFMTVQLSAQKQRVIKDVVLLNVEPYEVLMTDEGDIIAKIRHLPNYLITPDVIQQQRVNTEIASREPKREIPGNVKKVEEKSNISDSSEVALTEPSVYSPTINKAKGHYEVNFVKGTATLSNEAISILNDLAQVLKQNPDRKIQVFGFKNESPIIASLLSKRRQDACIAYLRIKGVNIDQQVRKGSVTDGVSNKIVFGFE